MGNYCGLCNVLLSHNQSHNKNHGDKHNKTQLNSINACEECCQNKSKNYSKRQEWRRRCRNEKQGNTSLSKSTSKIFFPSVKFDVIVPNPTPQSMIPITLVDNVSSSAVHENTTQVASKGNEDNLEETVMYSMDDINLSLDAERMRNNMSSVLSRSNATGTTSLTDNCCSNNNKDKNNNKNNNIENLNQERRNVNGIQNNTNTRQKNIVCNDTMSCLTNNMSFTNSFVDVNNDAVTTFVNNVLQLNNRLDEVGLLEESVLAPAMFADPILQTSFKNTRLSLPGLTPGLPFSAEDNEYIEHGGEEQFKIQRLCEVEYATRQNIINAWNISNRFLQLGSARMVPTLRTRRIRQNSFKRRARNDENKDNNHDEMLNSVNRPVRTPMTEMITTTTGGEGTCTAVKQQAPVHKRQRYRHQRPILIIHANDIQIDSGSFIAAGGNSEHALAECNLVPATSTGKTDTNIATQTLDNAALNETKMPTQIIDGNIESAINRSNKIYIDSNVRMINNENKYNNNINNLFFHDVNSHLAYNNEVPILTFTAPPISASLPNSATRFDTERRNDILAKEDNNVEKTSLRSPRKASEGNLMDEQEHNQVVTSGSDKNYYKADVKSNNNVQDYGKSYDEQMIAYTTPSVVQNSRAVGDNNSVEHFEVLALSCQGIYPNDKVDAQVEYSSWDFLSREANAQALARGDCVFRFLCMPTNQLDSDSLDLIDTFVNVTAFTDELRENNTPVINIRRPEEINNYICIMVKSMYLLPDVKISDISAPLIASKEYQKACQPSGNKVEDSDAFNTFRINITVIRFIFNMKVQFRVSEVTDPGLLQSFRIADGIIPAKAICLERTKRNIEKTDATVKARSILLYYPVNGGVLVSNQSIVLNTSLPTIVSKIVNSFGSQSASQSAETVRLARKYFSRRSNKLEAAKR